MYLAISLYLALAAGLGPGDAVHLVETSGFQTGETAPPPHTAAADAGAAADPVRGGAGHFKPWVVRRCGGVSRICGCVAAAAAAQRCAPWRRRGGRCSALAQPAAAALK